MCLVCGVIFSSTESFCDDCLNHIDSVRDGLPIEPEVLDEEFRIIVGFPKYEVGNLGSIRVLKTRQILKPREGKGGVMQVSIKGDKVNTSVSVHRLVAAYFLKGYKDGYAVKHKNDDYDDNRAVNLAMTKTLIKPGRKWKPRAA